MDEATGPRELATAAPVIGQVLPVVPLGLRPDDPVRVPDVMLDAVVAGGRCVAAASLIGLGHRAGGGCRQDAYSLCVDPDGRVCVAVADGLGSRPASHLGSALFVESVALAARAEPTGDPAELLLAAQERTERLALQAYGLSGDDLSLVAAVALVTEAGVTIARVGDVTAFAVRDGGFVEVFPPGDGYLNLVTTTIPGVLAEAVETALVGGTDPVALVTDGVATDLRASGGVRAWLASRWREPLGPFAMGDSLQYRRQGSHDDRTAVVVWP